MLRKPLCTAPCTPVSMPSWLLLLMWRTFEGWALLPLPCFHSPSLWEAASFIKWLNFIALLSFLIICLLSQPSWELIGGKTWTLELFQVIFFRAPGHPGNWFIYSSPPCNLPSTSLTPRNSMWQPVTKGNMWLPNPIIIMTFDALDSETNVLPLSTPVKSRKL